MTFPQLPLGDDGELKIDITDLEDDLGFDVREQLPALWQGLKRIAPYTGVIAPPIILLLHHIFFGLWSPNNLTSNYWLAITYPDITNWIIGIGLFLTTMSLLILLVKSEKGCGEIALVVWLSGLCYLPSACIFYLSQFGGLTHQDTLQIEDEIYYRASDEIGWDIPEHRYLVYQCDLWSTNCTEFYASEARYTFDGSGSLTFDPASHQLFVHDGDEMIASLVLVANPEISE